MTFRQLTIIFFITITQEPSWATLSKESSFDSVSSRNVTAVEISLPIHLHEQLAIVFSDIEA